uniref:M15 family metallopeptidase n=1 Tax=uncultured Sphingomonas sp. TaxID=158754 RepID=UPI0035CA4330
MSDSRDLADLQPHVRVMAQQLLDRTKAAGIPLIVTFTRRSLARQAALYAQGRTTAGAIVTNAKPGDSFHNYGLALDVVPTELLALPHWGDTPDHQAHTDVLWAQLGAIGKSIGFRWGGEFHSIRDRPHFEWSGSLTLADLKRGRNPDSSPFPFQLSQLQNPQGD